MNNNSKYECIFSLIIFLSSCLTDQAGALRGGRGREEGSYYCWCIKWVRCEELSWYIQISTKCEQEIVRICIYRVTNGLQSHRPPIYIAYQTETRNHATEVVWIILVLYLKSCGEVLTLSCWATCVVTIIFLACPHSTVQLKKEQHKSYTLPHRMPGDFDNVWHLTQKISFYIDYHKKMKTTDFKLCSSVNLFSLKINSTVTKANIIKYMMLAWSVSIITYIYYIHNIHLHTLHA